MNTNFAFIDFLRGLSGLVDYFGLKRRQINVSISPVHKTITFKQWTKWTSGLAVPEKWSSLKRRQINVSRRISPRKNSSSGFLFLRASSQQDYNAGLWIPAPLES